MDKDDGIKSILFGDTMYSLDVPFGESVTITCDDSNINSTGYYNMADCALPLGDDFFTITGSNLEPNIVVGGEKIDAKMIKKLRLLLDVISTDERFKDIMNDINTQIAFEELSKDNEN